MIVMNLKLNNFLVFRDFEINMSYPKKIVGSSIPNEHLLSKPNFRYKKLIILMGANATGKTALGRILMGILNFINKKEYGTIVGLIEDRTKEASFEMDFVAEEETLYRINTSIAPLTEGNYESNDISVTVKSVKILSNDNYERCSSRFETTEFAHNDSYITELEKIPPLTWMFEYPFASEGKQKVIKPVDDTLYQMYLKAVLHALDPRLKDVVKIPEAEGTYVILRKNNAIIMENGELKSPEKLSSGTQEGIGVANVLAAMKLHACGFYYCDEKFSHIHSEVEKAFLSLLVELLGPNEQLFFTTHNSDVLEMDFPSHSYAFMRRDEYTENSISCVYASDYIKKNDVSLKSAIENDIFSASPDVTEIFSILQM